MATLTVVGTGIAIGEHLTPQARVAFEHADEALYLVGDPVAVGIARAAQPARALATHALRERASRASRRYEAMVEEILSPLRPGADVCAAFYGHPAVFVYPGHRRSGGPAAEGFQAWMLPGISSLDCLWCDLGDRPRGAPAARSTPRRSSCSSGESPDTAATLVLLQINVIGQSTTTRSSPTGRGCPCSSTTCRSSIQPITR